MSYTNVVQRYDKFPMRIIMNNLFVEWSSMNRIQSII